MTDLPEPFVPPDCSMQDWPALPLDVARLFDSDTYALLPGAEFKAALSLWAKSWHLIPAGSMPNDDRLLARFAGVTAVDWQGIKPLVMQGWTLCSDGRLYHAVVCEKALEGMLAKIEATQNGARGNQKRWGADFDEVALDARIDDVRRRLLRLNPRVKMKPKRRTRETSKSPPDVSRVAPRLDFDRVATENPSPPDLKSSLRREEKGSKSGEDTHARTFVRSEWLERLIEVAGPGLDDPKKNPSLTLSAAELDLWANAGVDLERDAVPVIRALTANRRPDPIGTWGWFRKPVLRALAAVTENLSPDLESAKESTRGSVQRTSAPSEHATARQRGLAALLAADDVDDVGPAPGARD